MATLTQALQIALDSEGAGLPADVQRVVLKEYLQAYVLDYLYNHPQYRHLNFYGGTCLHAIYGLNRLSEDIDLDDSAEIDLTPLAGDLEGYFHARLGYSGLTLHEQDSGNDIIRLTLRFPLLNELGLSPHADEKLHLKVEISQHRQTAIVQHTPILYHGRTFVPSHFSIETMMAGKMIACIERSFAVGTTGINSKGRDYYDLLWFMARDVWPLEEKLAKDGQQPYTVATAFALIRDRVERISPAEMGHDLKPLFREQVFVQAWLESFHETFARLCERYVHQPD